jgi:flagellin
VAGASGAVDYAGIQGTAYNNWSSTGSAHLEFSINGAASVAIPPIDLAAGDATWYCSRSGDDLAQAINAAITATPALAPAALVASFDGTSLTIASGNGTCFRVNPGGSDTTADIGFGTAGAAFASTLTAPQATSNAVVSSGASAVASLSFTPLTYGNDDQTITVSAADLNGNPQTATVTLRNNASGREGRDIDETIADINAQLQQGNSTLQQIVAVKENVGGVEQIGFISNLRAFQVAVGDSVNGGGLNGGVAISEDSSPVGSLINVSVATEESALTALTAIDGAVSSLGAAQAVVGKAENQLNYAISLSQSQVTSFSAAESRIRDTDVAADAANLTKSQIIAQASMAAMSQANSAAQAVLALLKG